MIGQVAKESGLAASAIRFYEQAGVLPKPVRAAGRRQYDPSILERLAVLERARACGFSLAEIRRLFYGFPHGTPPSARWQALARRKLAELEQLEANIAATREMLLRPCSCRDLAECGRRISPGNAQLAQYRDPEVAAAATGIAPASAGCIPSSRNCWPGSADSRTRATGCGPC